MKRGSRWATSALLAGALAVLAVPAAVNLAPAVQLRNVQAQPMTITPAAQLPPTALSEVDLIGDLDPGAPAPDPAVLAAQLEPALALGAGSLSASVLDAATGTELYGRASGESRAPASALKILTGAAALTALGAEETLSTTVVRGPDANSVVLVGGGDVLLGRGPSDPGRTVGRAGLASLAADTVEALLSVGVTGTIRVAVDDTFFAGPAISSAWSAGVAAAGEIAPVQALALYSGFNGEDPAAGRTPDPAMAAGEAFRAALAEAAAGRLEVVPGVARSGAPAAAAPLATASSAPVADQVAHMLQTSDNYLAEALARSTAAAMGKPASFGGGTEAVKEGAARLGIDTAGMVLTDASGLSGANRVTARQLAEALRRIATSADPDVRRLVPGLPVAGLSGTLSGRLTEGPATGVVRAKTGTLLAVTSLTGMVVSADGRPLVFSFVYGDLHGATTEARAAADRGAAVLAACGCR